MTQHLDNLASRWMRHLKIHISKVYLKEKFFSHPNNPFLLSVTDTLDEFGIKNIAIKIEKEQFGK